METVLDDLIEGGGDCDYVIEPYEQKNVIRKVIKFREKLCFVSISLIDWIPTKTPGI